MPDLRSLNPHVLAFDLVQRAFPVRADGAHHVARAVIRLGGEAVRCQPWRTVPVRAIPFGDALAIHVGCHEVVGHSGEDNVTAPLEEVK